MHVEDTGRGEVVVLLHGTPSPPADLAPLAAALARTHRVLVPHLPGFGRSAAPADASNDATARALVEVLASRGIDRVAALAGFSSGGYRALDLALRHGVATDRVIALAGLAWIDDELRAVLRGAAAALRADPTAAAVRPGLPARWLSESWRRTHPEDEARVMAWLDVATPAALVTEIEAQTLAPDLRPLLPQLAARLFLRVGEQDVACPPASSEEMAQLAPHAELAIVPGVGHALLVEDAEPTLRWVVDAVTRA